MKLTRDNLHDFIRGAAILGTGGGGDPQDEIGRVGTGWSWDRGDEDEYDGRGGGGGAITAATATER